ncbi:MAG: ArdC family protein, partial [Deltaproteobacteria bacterium]|nr:ArdC family protein [Deltaproteobacteria bacterium]
MTPPPKNRPPAPRQTFTETVRGLLEEGQAPWQKPWAADGWSPFNPVSGTVYRGLNRLMLSEAEFTDPRWLTFPQLDGLGFWIKKGERGKSIEFWQTSEESRILDENGNPVILPNGQPQIVKV